MPSGPRSDHGEHPRATDHLSALDRWARRLSSCRRNRTASKRRDILRGHVQTQPLEPERVPENAPVNGPIRADFRHQVRPDEHHVQDVTTPPRRREPHPLKRVPGASRGQVLADLPGHLRAQRYRPAHSTQPAVLVAAAEDKEPGAG